MTYAEFAFLSIVVLPALPFVLGFFRRVSRVLSHGKWQIEEEEDRQRQQFLRELHMDRIGDDK